MAVGYRLAAAVGRRDRGCEPALAGAMRHGMGMVGIDAGGGMLDRFFSMRAREVLDAWWIRRLAPEQGPRLIALRGERWLSDREAGGGGTVLVMAHYGRPNLLALGLALRGHRLGMLTVDLDDPALALDPRERAFLRFKVLGLHARIGGAWVTVNQGLKGLYRRVAAGETVIILLDAFASRFRLPLAYPFLGGRLHLPAGILRIARRTGARLLYGVVKEREWRVDVELRPLPGEPEAAMAQAVAELERDVRERPWEWWQWPLMEQIWRASD